MENKPQNVFEKLDKQGKQIDDIATKLEGISVSDLYALAKRTWDYGDFETAQKYYNHISLLRPLDWEAPFYASLCNFGGYHNIIFWATVPEQKEKIIVSTIEYINRLEMDIDKKELEMSKCIDIIKSELSSTKNHYFNYKDNYDSHKESFIYTLEDLFINIYSKVNDLKYNCVKDFKVFLADNLLEIIYKTLKITANISKDKYNELIEVSLNKLKYDYEELKMKHKVSEEEKRNIKLKGKLYCEYNDKVISKRIFRNRIILGMSSTLLSIASMIIGFLCSWFFIIPFVFPFLYGSIILIMAFLQKERVYCYSQFCMNRKRTRLTSNNDITVEDCHSFVKIYSFVGWYLSLLSLGFTAVGLFTIDKINIVYKYILLSTTIILIIIIFLSFFCITRYNSDKMIYMYLYNGKFYPCDKEYN